MSLYFQKIWRRLITILIYSPVLILAGFLGGLSFYSMMLLLGFMALNEIYHNYSFKKKGFEYYHIGYLIFMLMITSAFAPELAFIWQHMATIVLTIIFCLYFSFELFLRKIFFIDNAPYFMVRSLIFVGLMITYLILLRESANGLYKMVFLLSVVWTNDIFAYLIGKPLGRHKLSPDVSPKKSIEGAIGAMLGAVLMSVNLRAFIYLDLEQAIIMGLVISILAQTGDLVESLLKRALHLKDSGDFMPGHGGILDRLDSFILSAPIFYLLTNYFLK